MHLVFKRLFLKPVLAICSLAVAFPMGTAISEQLSGFAIVFPLMSPQLSSKFGMRKHPIQKTVRHHSGVDLAAPTNAHVRAVAPGTVVFADTYGAYGKLVTITHENGITSLYGHLNKILVQPGTRVEAGALIGRVGSTGAATGPHLHFEWRKNGHPIDPMKVFPNLAADAEG